MADVTDATFATAVVERSNTVPVIVDLWAPWCGPCKTLGPILDKVVAESGGLVELAKVNVDENPQVSQAFQVQSIPAVYAMRDGQVVDGFMGAVPEADVVALVQRLIDGSSAAPAEDDDADDAETSVPGAGTATDDGAVIDAPPEEAPAVPALDEAEVVAVEAELEALLAAVKADDAARERYLELLDQLGPEHPTTNTWRRRLTTALF